MKAKTMDDWIKLYEKKTGVKFEPDSRATLKFDPEVERIKS